MYDFTRRQGAIDRGEVPARWCWLRQDSLACVLAFFFIFTVKSPALASGLIDNSFTWITSYKISFSFIGWQSQHVQMPPLKNEFQIEFTWFLVQCFVTYRVIRWLRTIFLLTSFCIFLICRPLCIWGLCMPLNKTLYSMWIFANVSNWEIECGEFQELVT